MISSVSVGVLLFVFGLSVARSIQNASDIETKDVSVDKKMELLELNLKNLTETIRQMKKEQEEDKLRPMFFVRLSSTTTLQVHSIVKFNDIVIDEGDNFNSGDGIFVAPVSGIYLFSWTIQEYQGNYAYTDLRVENIVKGTLNVALSGNENYNVATRVLFCKVQKGDHVWIQTRGDGTGNYFHTFSNSKSSFLGILMKKE